MKSDDWEILIWFSAIVLFFGCGIICNRYVTRRRYPDGIPMVPGFGPVNGIAGGRIAFSNFFVGWKNVSKWQLQRVMTVWTIVVCGLLSFFLIGAAPPPQRFNPWFLVPFAIALITTFETGKLVLASLRVERMRVKPGTETVSAVIRLGRRAVPELIQALRDDEPVVRSASAEALGAIREPAKSANPALRSLQSHSDRFVAQMATEAIRKIDPFQRAGDVD